MKVYLKHLNGLKSGEDFDFDVNTKNIQLFQRITVMADMECLMSAFIVNCTRRHATNNNKFRLNKYDERYRIKIIAITKGNLVNRYEQTI